MFNLEQWNPRKDSGGLYEFFLLGDPFLYELNVTQERGWRDGSVI